MEDIKEEVNNFKKNQQERKKSLQQSFTNPHQVYRPLPSNDSIMKMKHSASLSHKYLPQLSINLEEEDSLLNHKPNEGINKTKFQS